MRTRHFGIDNQILKQKQPAVEVEESKVVNAVIEQWVREADVAALTEKSYRAAANAFAAYLSSNKVVLSETALIEYREHLKRTRAVSTAKLYFGLARKFTAWMAKRGYISFNYGEGLKGVKLAADVHNRDAVSANDAAEAIAAVSGTDKISVRNRAIMSVLAGCGLRSVEVVRLDVKDMEKRRGVWTLRVHGKARAGKSDTVVLPDEVKAEIDAYMKMRGRVNANAPLFVSESRRNAGARLHTQTVSGLVKAAFRKIGIDSARITCHSLRHANATIALDAGVDIDSVALNLRHRSTATTSIYRHDTKVFTNDCNRVVAREIFGRLKELVSNGETAKIANG